MSSESTNDSNRRIVEEVLRRDIPEGKVVKTEGVVGLCNARGVDRSAAYSAVLAIARRCPAARQDRDHSFVRFGRTCYPWVWRKLEPAEPLMVEEQAVSRLNREGQPPPAVLTLTAADFAEIERRIAALLGIKGELQLATIGALTDAAEPCILCSTEGQGYVNGICPACSEQEV